MMPVVEDYCQLSRFCESIANKLIAVDPLDRELWSIVFDEDSNEEKVVDHGTKIKNLEKIIDKMTPADGKQLFAPLSDERYNEL